MTNSLTHTHTDDIMIINVYLTQWYFEALKEKNFKTFQKDCEKNCQIMKTIKTFKEIGKKEFIQWMNEWMKKTTD